MNTSNRDLQLLAPNTAPAQHLLPTAASTLPLAGEFLAFLLGEQTYAIDILSVQEIRGFDHVTRLPDCPNSMKGVINLRGAIVPVIDLRARIGLGEVARTGLTVMIVVNLGNRTVGLVVDSVSDVVPISTQQICPAPAVGTQMDNRMLAAVGVLENRMVLLLDVARVLHFDEPRLAA